MCPKIYRCIIIRNWNLILFWSVFVLWQTAGQTKWLLINPALTNIFCNSRVHPLSRSVGPMYKKFNWWQNTVGYRMEQHMVQILDGIFLGDIQVGFNIGAKFLATLSFFFLCTGLKAASSRLADLPCCNPWHCEALSISINSTPLHPHNWRGEQ